MNTLFAVIAASFPAYIISLLCYRRAFPVLYTVIISSILSWFFLPTTDFQFFDLWFLDVISVAIAGVIFAIVSSDDFKKVKGHVTLPLGGAFVIFLGGVAYMLSSGGMFHANAYSSLLGKVNTMRFAEAVQPLELNSNAPASNTVLEQHAIRLVDEAIATRRAQELLGQDPDLGGTFSLGEMQLTRRDGRLVWATPLEFNGLWRWMAVMASPGYVWVDAHDPHEAALVRDIDGQKLQMRCTQSAWFGSNLERVAWSENPTSGQTDYSFELGPNGRPYYVVTTYHHTIGFEGSDPTGVIVVDPQDCSTASYDISHIPSWVNRVVPDWMAREQAELWASYAGGWFNQSALGSHNNLRLITPGMELVSTSAGGDTAWYMGVATPGNPNGTTGFLLVDSRTKKVSYFEQNGATEQGAAQAILGKVSNMQGWSTTLPILYNISGQPTYLSILKDSAGNFKQVALMPVDDRNLVVVADDLSRALIAYSQAMAGRANGFGPADAAAGAIKFEGHVVRFQPEISGGNTSYWFTVSERPGVAFNAPSTLGPQVALTHSGDTVQVRARSADQTTYIVLEYINHDALPAAISPTK